MKHVPPSRITATLATAPPSQLDLVLVAMRRGRCLLLELGKGPTWHLSDGSQVSAEIATALLLSGSIIAAGDAMAPGSAVSNWRIRR